MHLVSRNRCISATRASGTADASAGTTCRCNPNPNPGSRETPNPIQGAGCARGMKIFAVGAAEQATENPQNGQRLGTPAKPPILDFGSAGNGAFLLRSKSPDLGADLPTAAAVTGAFLCSAAPREIEGTWKLAPLGQNHTPLSFRPGVPPRPPSPRALKSPKRSAFSGRPWDSQPAGDGTNITERRKPRGGVGWRGRPELAYRRPPRRRTS